jgi:hypothetical protein
LAGVVAAIVLYWGFRARRRWAAATQQLAEVAVAFETSHGARTHRVLYRSFDELMLALAQAAQSYPEFGWVFEELRPAMLQFHRRAMAGAGAAWGEIRDAFLERARHPVRLTRGAAGWVVLIGLAGTVLGFLDVIPALREVVTEEEIVAPTGPQGAPVVQADPTSNASKPDSGAEGAVAAGRKLRKVLGSLQGVFLATLFGVSAAIVLSVFNLVGLEPAFDRFASQVDIFGARWVVPLVQAPDTLIDDALRGELRSYFEEVSRNLDLALAPLVGQLRKSLEQMSGLATDFSSNIRMGVSTLESFHEAVGKLGSSAQGAVDQLVKIVETSSDFVHEVETLQQKGMEQLSSVLSGPAERLAGAAAALEGRVGALEENIGSLGRSSSAIAQVLGQSQRDQQVLRQEIAHLNETLEGQSRAFSRLEGDFDSIGGTVGDGIHGALIPLFEALPRELLEAQRQAASENRDALQQIASTISAIQETRSTRTQALEPSPRPMRETHDVPTNRTATDQVRLLGEIRGLLNQCLLESRDARQSWAGKTYERIRTSSEDWSERLRNWVGNLRR